MRNLLLGIFALAALPGSALQAQNITGTWQGSLKAGAQELRTVIKISLEDDKLKAVFYSIDQRSPAIPVNTIVKDGSNIKMTISALNGSYEGKVSADGNSMTGTWTQGAPLPLNLVRATPETAWAIPEPPPPPTPMAAKADPGIGGGYDQAERARAGRANYSTLGGLDIVTVNTTLSDLVTMAYNLHSKQLIGLPAWADSDKYDITIRPDIPGQPNRCPG